jgi:hypothetical protein
MGVVGWGLGVSTPNSSRIAAILFSLELRPSFIIPCTLSHFQPITAAAMAQPLPRFLSRRLCQPSLIKQQIPVPRAFRPQLHRAPARRTYATGESGPNPKPGQNPFKVWPFIAITLAGSGAYALMVKSRAGTSHCFLTSNLLSVEVVRSSIREPLQPIAINLSLRLHMQFHELH